jgi:hypothetical protein
MLSLLQRCFESIPVNAHLVVIVFEGKTLALLFNMLGCIGSRRETTELTISGSRKTSNKCNEKHRLFSHMS